MFKIKKKLKNAAIPFNPWPFPKQRCMHQHPISPVLAMADLVELDVLELGVGGHCGWFFFCNTKRLTLESGHCASAVVERDTGVRTQRLPSADWARAGRNPCLSRCCHPPPALQQSRACAGASVFLGIRMQTPVEGRVAWTVKTLSNDHQPFIIDVISTCTATLPQI